MFVKNAIELKKEAENFLWKYDANDDDQKMASILFCEAINKYSDNSMSIVQLADCYARLGLSYIKKIEKEENDFENAILAFEKILTLNIPSWYNQTDAISLLINPIRFGFHIKYKDIDRAKKIGFAKMDAGELYQVACKWSGRKDATFEEIDFAESYFIQIVTNGFDYENYTHAMAYCRLGIIYAYNKDKTKEIFDKACYYFEKSITYPSFQNYYGNQRCIPYCHYSIFLSRASDAKFPKEYENHELSIKYNEEIEKICIHNPKELYYKAGEQYQFHPIVNENYLQIAEKYYQKVLQKENNIDNIKIIIMHYIGDMYANKKLKTLDNYVKSLEYSMNTIISTLKIKKEGGDVSQVSCDSLKNILTLIYTPYEFHFNQDFSCHEKAFEIKDKIKNMNNEFIECKMDIFIKIIEVFNKLHTIKLKKEDIIFQERQKKIIDKHTNEKNDQELDDLLSTKEKLLKIQENQILNEYYDGFLRTFTQVYATSIIIKSGQLNLNTDNIGVTIASKLISLIPLIGDKISENGKAIWSFIKGIEMINRATNVVKFTTTQEQFNEFVQEAIIEIIHKEEKNLLENEKKEEKSKNWYDKKLKFFEKIKVTIKDSIYVEELETPMQQLGSKDATKLISDWISNGKIYGEEKSIRIPLSIKKDRFIEYGINIIINDDTKDDIKDDTKDKNNIVDYDHCWCYTFFIKNRIFKK